MPGGGGGGTSSVTLPSYIDELAQDNVDDVRRISSQPYQGYDMPRIAGFTPDTNTGFQAVRNSVGAGQDSLSQARDALGRVVDFQAPTVSGQQTALRTMASPGNVSARTLPGTDLSRYMNPFLGAAVDPVLREISTKAAADRSSGQADAALSGAFGSDQNAIMQSESFKNENQARSDALGQMLMGGYDRATGLSQQDSDRLLQAATQNQGMGFNVGSTNLNALLGTDRANADRDLQAATANQNAAIQANAQRLSAIGAGGSLASLEQALAQGDAAALMNIGEQQRQMGQGSLDLAYGDFLRQQMHPLNMVNLRTAAITGNPYSVEYDTPGGSGKGGEMMGLAGTLGSAAIMACWIAREVYGAENPKWLIFRDWLMTKAPAALRNAYLMHGADIAANINDKPRAKAVIRRMMDRAVA